MSNFQLLSQLGYAAPSLAVYGVAFVLALVYRRRAPRASTLTLAGACILVFTTLAGIASTAYLIYSMSAGSSPATSQMVMSLINFTINGVRAVGLLLLVLAIFAGRGPSGRQQRQAEAPWEEDGPRRGAGGEPGQFREGRGR